MRKMAAAWLAFGVLAGAGFAADRTAWAQSGPCDREITEIETVATRSRAEGLIFSILCRC